MRFFGLWMVVLTGLNLSVRAANDKDLESFQKVWDTINEKHWDLAGTGADWQAIYTQYKPLIEKAKTRSETRTLLNQMLGELGQSHFKILERQTQARLDELNTRFIQGSGQPGFKVAMVGNRVFIVKLEPSSDAARQGLGIGVEILKLRGEDLRPVVKTVREVYEETAHAGLYLAHTLNAYFSGAVGDELPLEIRMDGQIENVKIVLRKPKGKYMDLLNLTDIYFQYESQIINGNIGYVAFNTFLLDAKIAFEKDLSTIFKQTDGLIIDLRGNPGGLGLISVSLANRLISEKGLKLGQMTNSGGTLNFAIFPQKPIFDRPVAILVDEGSASTSEILAAGLQDLERARIFGIRSAGAALPSMIIDLPNGDRFQFAIADYISYKGQSLEGIGVMPDELTPHTLESMRRKEDAALQAATLWIQTQASTGAKNEKSL